ncbi:MAG: hemolysin family protein [Acidimicrobiales bacterium]
MPIDGWLGFLAVALLIAVNALFVAGEFALVAADAARINALGAEGGRRARVVAGLRRRLSFHLSGAQLGITLSSLVLGFVAQDTIGSFLGFIPGIEADGASTAALALLVATVSQLLFGELIPKNLAIARPEGVSLFLAPILAAYGKFASPVIRSFDASANWLVRRMGVEPAEELSSTRSREELAYVIKNSSVQGTMADDVLVRLERVIRFGDRNVADILIPRADVVAVRAVSPLADLTALSIETGRSRFPVIGDDLDDLRGMVEVTDVLAIELGERSEATVEQIAREPLVVPEGRALDRLLDDFRAADARFAVVVDEHGGTAGIVTLEDLLEELVGEIDDEYDQVAVTHTRRAGLLEVDASLHLDDVGELIGDSLPDGPYETIGGFTLWLAGRIPSVGERLAWGDWAFDVLEADRRRVSRIAIRHVPAPEQTPGASR